MKIYLALALLLLINSINYSQCPSSINYFGKIYHTIKISNQCWLKENLDVGTMITGTQSPDNNGEIEKYCYNNDPNNCSKYGGLYTWNEAMLFNTDSRAQGICPDGWHIPSKEEFETLIASVNRDGNALKVIGQDKTSTNTSGFSALLAGNRDHDGSFSNLGDEVCFWSSTQNQNSFSYVNYLVLTSYDNDIDFDNDLEEHGHSVRCVKDN
jgi:uncharacterized protein (TIGR02145 family)